MPVCEDEVFKWDEDACWRLDLARMYSQQHFSSSGVENHSTAFFGTTIYVFSCWAY